MIFQRDDLSRVICNIRIPLAGFENIGTGVFIVKDEQLYLVTAAHVVKNLNVNAYVIISGNTGDPMRMPLNTLLQGGAFENHPTADLAKARINMTYFNRHLLESRFFPYVQIIKLGMQSAEFSQALIRVSNACQNYSRKGVEKISGIYKSGGEMITAADGSIKKYVIVGKNYESLEPERVKVEWAERPRKIGIVSGGTYGASGIEIIKPGSEIFVVRKDSLPELSRSLTETIPITPKILEGLMAINQNKNGNSISVFYGSREWKGKKTSFR